MAAAVSGETFRYYGSNIERQERCIVRHGRQALIWLLQHRKISTSYLKSWTNEWQQN